MYYQLLDQDITTKGKNRVFVCIGDVPKNKLLDISGEKSFEYFS